MTELEQLREQVREVATKYLGKTAGEAFASLGLPVVHLLVGRKDADGRSRLGGAPVLDAGEPWPTWNGRPLRCLAVVDLAEVAEVCSGLGLPVEGTLSFFYDSDRQEAWGREPSDRGAWRVVHAAPGAAPVEGPAGADEFPAVPVLLQVGWSCPSWEEDAVDELPSVDEDACFAMYDALGAWGWPPLAHRVCGWPTLVQGPVQRTCQLAANGHPSGRRSARNPALSPLLEDADSWKLLAQFASDDTLGWQWADGGVLYFMIHEHDLTARRFDNAWMVLQSH